MFTAFDNYGMFIEVYFLSLRILFVNLFSMNLFRIVSMDGVLLGVVIAQKNPIVTIGASEKKKK